MRNPRPYDRHKYTIECHIVPLVGCYQIILVVFRFIFCCVRNCLEKCSCCVKNLCVAERTGCRRIEECGRTAGCLQLQRKDCCCDKFRKVGFVCNAKRPANCRISRDDCVDDIRKMLKVVKSRPNKADCCVLPQPECRKVKRDVNAIHKRVMRLKSRMLCAPNPCRNTVACPTKKCCKISRKRSCCSCKTKRVKKCCCNVTKKKVCCQTKKKCKPKCDRPMRVGIYTTCVCHTVEPAYLKQNVDRPRRNKRPLQHYDCSEVINDLPLYQKVFRPD